MKNLQNLIEMAQKDEVLREKIEKIYGNTLDIESRNELATLIYYPEEKLKLIREKSKNIEDFYRISLIRLIEISKLVSSKYTRSKVRKAMPNEFKYVIDELLHENYNMENKEKYYETILKTIIDIGKAEAFIIELTKFIKRLAIDQLHIVGDIFDRGPAADKIIELLMAHHSVDIEWGNHDILWMGAAAGSMACIATVLNISMQYNNLNVIENSYGINLRPLAIFAQECYGSSEYFAPKLLEEEILKEKDVALISKIHKAIVMIQLKLEGQIIMRNKEFDMEERLLLNKINYSDGTIMLNDKKYELRDKDFPTINPNNPYELSEDELEVMEKLVVSFRQSEKLQKHIQLIYQKGSLYNICNKNLIFHGCIPTNNDGEFTSLAISGENYSGKALMDKAEVLVRKAYFSPDDSPNKQKGMDFIWYLWCGKSSPLFGREKMTTFERYFISDKSVWEEKKDNYYKFKGALATDCLMPAAEFELEYELRGNELSVSLSYELADYIENFPRMGFEFNIKKNYNKFSYVGYGPYESYVDKHIACEYGYYESTAEENYDYKYIRPQESGSHFASKYLNVENLFELTAAEPFSFSVNPYTTVQLRNTSHNFHLPKDNDFVTVCVDLAQRGVGTMACGPALAPEYEIPKKFKNTLKFKF